MAHFPDPTDPARKTSKSLRKRKLPWALLTLLVLLIVLLFVVPELFVLIALIGLVLSLIGMAKGKVPGLPVNGRKNSGWLGFGMAALLVTSSAVVDPNETTPPTVASVTNDPILTSTESPSAATSESPSPSTISEFLNVECDSDELVMEQGPEKLYCDEASAGALVWTAQEQHDKNLLAAKLAAEEKAQQEKIAAEKKIAEEEAAKEKTVAEKKLAEENAAKEKTVAEKKLAEENAAKAKAEAEKKEAKEKQASAAKKAEERKASEKATAKKAEEKRLAQQKEAARVAEQPIKKKPTPKKAPSSAYYKNCTAVRAAGAAPIYKGDPGYSRKLDRDGDGIGCEK